jgi:hypothetical protein
MRYRTLKNGEKVSESKTAIPMTIKSKCPKKWLFIDMETGDVWMHKSRTKHSAKSLYDFFRADEKAIQALMAVAVLAVAHKLKELE